MKSSFQKRAFYRLVLVEEVFGEGGEVDFGGAVGEAHVEGLEEPGGEGHFVGDAEGAVDLDGA